MTPKPTSALRYAGQAQAFDDSPADRARLRQLLATVLPALERYPSALLRQVRLRKVVLVKELAVDGQRRLAMPEPETDSVVYADNNVPSLCPAGMELRTHHEFYHFIEYRLFNDFYYRDPAWMAFNPAEVQYGLAHEVIVQPDGDFVPAREILLDSYNQVKR